MCWGSNLESLNIKSIFDLKEITYIGFTSVFLNLFKIRKKLIKQLMRLLNLSLIFYFLLTAQILL